MGNSVNDELEKLWEALLSRDSATIRSTFNQLPDNEQKNILLHLRRMANEPGWHPEQRISAQAALEALASGSEQV